MPIRLPRLPLLIGLAVTCLIVLVTTALSGAVSIGWSEIPNSLVFWQLRLPRVILAALVGAALATSGAVMQGLLRNPLADPSLIGVSSGAALGAVIAIVLGGLVTDAGFAASDRVFTPLAAFAGALAAFIVVLRLASHRGRTSIATLLLTGIAINSFAGAMIGFVTFIASDAQLRSLTFWMLGSLGIADWSVLAIAAPLILIFLAAAPCFARHLNALSLGESSAFHLGVDPQRVRRVLMALTCLGVGVCVALSGMIAFIGLAIPHMIRLAAGPDHRVVIPGSTLLGAILLPMADAFSRTVAAPAEIPVGIVTAALGAPFFLGLLMAQRRRLALA